MARKAAVEDVVRLINDSDASYDIGVVTCSYAPTPDEEGDRAIFEEIGQYLDSIGVALVVGPASSYATRFILNTAGSQMEPFQFVSLSPSATEEDLSRTNELNLRFFRTVPHDGYQAPRLARAIEAVLPKGARLQSIVRPDVYSEGLLKDVENALSADMELEVPYRKSIASLDYGELSQLGEDDGILVISRDQEDFTELFKELKKLGSKVGHIFVPDGAANDKALEPLLAERDCGTESQCLSDRVIGTRPAARDRAAGSADDYLPFVQDAAWAAFYALVWAKANGDPGTTPGDVARALLTFSEKNECSNAEAGFDVAKEWVDAASCMKNNRRIRLEGFSSTVRFESDGNIACGQFEVWGVRDGERVRLAEDADLEAADAACTD